MAHYAFLDDNNIVTEVITGRDENDTTGGVTDWEEWYGNFRGQTCKRTSYNTYYDYAFIYDDATPPNLIRVDFLGSKHRENGVPFRGKFAEIGDRYDSETDTFVAPTTEV